MNNEDERILAACNQLASLAREAITDAATDSSGELWAMVYGRLDFHADSQEELIQIFQRQYNDLNKGAATMILMLSQMYAKVAGVSQLQAIDEAQEAVRIALES